VREVDIDAVPLDRLAGLLEPARAARLARYVDRAREILEGRTIWNVNATAQGGGVAEMLQALLAYTRGAGVSTRWLVLAGDPAFFAITKRLHNVLHGMAGDGGPLGLQEQVVYHEVLERNAATLAPMVRPGDIVLLHDPQTAGLTRVLTERGAHVVWRCHIGRDTPTELTEVGWAFLRPHIEHAAGFIFSRRAYAPDWVPTDRLWVIPPSLDPFTAKNVDLTPADVDAALHEAALKNTTPDHGSLAFTRRDGSTGTVRGHRRLMVDGPPMPRGARFVLQVSRWDRLKDMAGVLNGVAGHLSDLPRDVHLLLAGPDVAGVSDDPEGAEVLQECRGLWATLPARARRRVHLACLPMDDIDENAHLVNALQRRAAVVVQKSLVEGFGLTVTEPMWKAKPVLASAVGGIQDQIVHGESGLLLQDPQDLDAFATMLVDLLTDEEYARLLGTGARSRVRDLFLGDRHLTQYVDLFERLVAAGPGQEQLTTGSAAP
jgi:trehalose synthase